MMSVLLSLASGAEPSCRGRRALLTDDALYCVDDDDTLERVDLQDGTRRRISLDGIPKASNQGTEVVVLRRARGGNYGAYSLDGSLLGGPAAVPHDESPEILWMDRPRLAFIRAGEIQIHGKETRVLPHPVGALAVRAAGRRLFWLADDQPTSSLMVSEYRDGSWKSLEVSTGQTSVPRAHCRDNRCIWAEGGEVHMWAPGSPTREVHRVKVEVYPYSQAVLLGNESWIAAADVLNPPDEPEVLLWSASSETKLPGMLEALVPVGELTCVLLAGSETADATREFKVTCVDSSTNADRSAPLSQP